MWWEEKLLCFSENRSTSGAEINKGKKRRCAPIFTVGAASLYQGGKSKEVQSENEKDEKNSTTSGM